MGKGDDKDEDGKADDGKDKKGGEDDEDGVVGMSEDDLEELMDEHGFISAIYWAVSDDDPNVLTVTSCVAGEWCDVSGDYTFVKGEDGGQPGRVWESLDYEYNENVQNLKKKKFHRQPVAVEVGIKGLLVVAHTEDGEFAGAVELGLKTDDPLDEEVLEAVKKVIQN